MSLFLSVCWDCGSSTGRFSARLNLRDLSFVALELWELGVALPRERQRSCRCIGSVATSRSSARLNRARLPFITKRTSTTLSLNDNSTIFWISWMVGIVLSTTWRISTVFEIFWTVSICLFAVGCTAGVITTLSDCRKLTLKHWQEACQVRKLGRHTTNTNSWYEERYGSKHGVRASHHSVDFGQSTMHQADERVFLPLGVCRSPH